TELVTAAEMMVGAVPQFRAVSIGWHDDVNDARGDISQAIDRVRGEEGVLLLTDMFGGTPSNLGMTFLEKDRIEVITGVNLPMLIKLASLRSSSDLLGVAREMRDHARDAIWVASDLLRGERVSPGQRHAEAESVARRAEAVDRSVSGERGWGPASIREW